MNWQSQLLICLLFLGLFSKYTIPLYKLHFSKRISLPGRHYHVELRHTITEFNQTKLIALWVPDEYHRYHTLRHKPAKNCAEIKHLWTQFRCRFISYEDKSTERHRYYFISDAKLKTWNEARKICTDIGAHLPHFTSREQLEKLLALLKLSEYVPLVEAMYIGLVYNSSEVRESSFHNFLPKPVRILPTLIFNGRNACQN